MRAFSPHHRRFLLPSVFSFWFLDVSLSSFAVQILLLCLSLNVSPTTKSTIARSGVGVVFTGLWLWWSNSSLCLAEGRLCCCHRCSTVVGLTPSFSEVVGGSVWWSSVLHLTVFCFAPVVAVRWLCVFVLQGHRSFSFVVSRFVAVDGRFVFVGLRLCFCYFVAIEIGCGYESVTFFYSGVTQKPERVGV